MMVLDDDQNIKFTRLSHRFPIENINNYEDYVGEEPPEEGTEIKVIQKDVVFNN